MEFKDKDRIRPQSDGDGELEHSLWTLVDQKNYSDAISLVKKKRNAAYIRDNSMELIPFLVLKLRDVSEEEAIQCIEDIIANVLKVTKLKECLIALVGVVPCLDNPRHFIVLLNSIKSCLLMMDSQNIDTSKHLSDCFQTLVSFFLKMELPSIPNLEEEERKLLTSDPLMMEHSHVFVALILFLENFISKASESSHKSNVARATTKSLIALFNKIAYLDIYIKKFDSSLPNYSPDQFTVDDNDLNELFIYTDEAIKWLIALNKGNLMRLADRIKISKKKADDDDDYDDEEPSTLSLATIFYCYFCQGMAGDDGLLYVYSSKYQFLNFLPLVCELMNYEGDLVLHKGLLLAQYFVHRIDVDTLEGDSLYSPCHSLFHENLVKSMTLSENKELRTMALDVFRRYVSIFTIDGSYILLETLLRTVHHSGLSGLVTSEIKQKYLLSLRQPEGNSKFQGRSLWNLIDLACNLPDGEKTDMLDNSEKILSALNLLIFFYLRAQREKVNVDQSFKKDLLVAHLKHIKNKFLLPLHTGLLMSREHYKLKIIDLDDKIKCGDKSKMEISVNVNNSLLPGSTPDQEKEFIQIALTRFDMIFCVLAQVNSTYDELNLKLENN